MTYDGAIKILYDLTLFGAKLGLEKVFRLAELAGNPQYKLRFIHVAGTNGKGSTCAMLESIYRASGYRTGLFTSPHLIRFSERVQVDRHPIPDAEVVRLVSAIQPLLQQFAPNEQPTFFEVVTVLALQYFAEQKCDIVIWETGLGGRLDATNIVTPLASLITNIGMDHEQWLGGTEALIAAEKAGIIKPGVPVISSVRSTDASGIIEGAAIDGRSPLTVVTKPITASAIELPLLGEHQRWNAALAVACVQTLRDALPVTNAAIAEGLRRVRWAGRLQLIVRGDGGRILLDGAHNMAGVDTLAATLATQFHAESPTLILGILKDKQWREMCTRLAPMAKRIFPCRIHSDRSADPASLAEACRIANPIAEVTAFEDLQLALDSANKDKFVVISGSLHFIGEAMERIGLEPTDARSERELNEWQRKPTAEKST